MKTNHVKVQFIAGTNTHKQYVFLTTIPDLKKGDLVVVDTQFGYSLAKVFSYTELEQPGLVMKYVVSKVDVETHENRLIKLKELAEVHEKMKKRKREIEERRTFRLLADQDEEMNKLLKKYQSLAGEIS